MVNDTQIYQAGNSIRLTCTFKDFDGNIVNPTEVRITFYNYKYERLESTTLLAENRIAEGTYAYTYTTPDIESRIIYEWYGVILDTPSIKRGSFRTVFL